MQLIFYKVETLLNNFFLTFCFIFIFCQGPFLEACLAERRKITFLNPPKTTSLQEKATKLMEKILKEAMRSTGEGNEEESATEEGNDEEQLPIDIYHIDNVDEDHE